MGQLRGGAPAGRQIPYARAGEHRAQHRRPRARLHPQGVGQGAAGEHDLVVEKRGVQPLAADLGGLLEDTVVGGLAGQCRAGALLARAADAGRTDGRVAEAAGHLGQCLAGEPACGGAGAAPGEGGE